MAKKIYSFNLTDAGELSYTNEAGIERYKGDGPVVQLV